MKQQSPEPRIGYFPEKPSAPSAEQRKPAFNPVRLALLCLCVCVFCGSLFLLVRYGYSIVISRSASNQLEEVYSAAAQQPSPIPTAAAPTPIPATATPSAKNLGVQQTVKPLSLPELWPDVYPDNPTLRVSPVFYQLQQQNPDIVGWLKIEGVLEEPVLQRDNDYYLTHNSLGQRSVTGALFLDENCALNSVPTQMLIHGHNMKEGAMFGSLMKYKVKDASFYRSHPFVDFNTIYENGRYVIFAVCEVDIRSGKPDYLPFWQNVRFTSADAFMNYVERAQLLSQIRCNVDVQPGDRILTLSTCTTSDDNKRLLVMARKLRDGENELELNMDIFTTSDR